VVDPEVEKRVRGARGYFTVRWSELLPLDKATVTRKIPSQAGVFEVYELDPNKTLVLIGRAAAYYGGLRKSLRALIDEDRPTPLKGRLLPRDKQLFLRYSLTESRDDMADVLFFFSGEDEARTVQADHSGRFRFIYLKEISPADIHAI
jgi:hypothetical protein